MTNILLKDLDIADFFVNKNFQKIAEITKTMDDLTKSANIPIPGDEYYNNENNFAVVIINTDGSRYPKYAMSKKHLAEINLGFLSSAESELPEEFLKIAASNLVHAASNFNLDIPENLKRFNSTKYINREFLITDIDETAFYTKLSSAALKNENIYALDNKFPITTEQDVVKTASWFNNNYYKLSLDDQLKFISNTKTQIEKLGIKNIGLITEFTKLDNSSFNPDFEHHVNIRKTYIDDNENTDVFNELIEQKNDLGPIKTAYVLDVLDKEFNLHIHYNNGILDPLRSVLKEAQVEPFVNFEGKKITKRSLEKIANNELAYLVGEGNVSDLKSDKWEDIFNSLPYPIQQEIADLIDE